MHDDHVVHVPLEPVVGAVAECLEQGERRAVVVVEGEARDKALKESAVVQAFGAQVEDLALSLRRGGVLLMFAGESVVVLNELKTA